MRYPEQEIDKIKAALKVAGPWAGRLRRALEYMLEENAAHDEQGPCPELASNRTPCQRWNGHPGPCVPSGARGPITNTWTVTDKKGREVARVSASALEEARRRAEENPAARVVSLREGGLGYRRLGQEELDEAS